MRPRMSAVRRVAMDKLKKRRHNLTVDSAARGRIEWEEWEDELIMSYEYSDVELALVLERTDFAVQHRRYLLSTRSNNIDDAVVEWRNRLEQEVTVHAGR